MMLYAMCDRSGRIFFSFEAVNGLELVGTGPAERLRPVVKALAQFGTGDHLRVPGVAEAADTEAARAVVAAFQDQVMAVLLKPPAGSAGEPA